MKAKQKISIRLSVSDLHAFIIVFHYSIAAILENGNLDLCFGIGIIYLMYALTQMKIIKKIICFWSSLLLVVILSLSINSYFSMDLELQEAFYWLGKILLNMSYMIFVSRTTSLNNMFYILKKTAKLLFILTAIAILFPAEPWWILNDVVNKYSTVRLCLLYGEPATLSITVGILLILSFGCNYYFKNRIFLWKEQVLFLILLLLSSGLSGIISTFSAFVVLGLLLICERIKKKRVFQRDFFLLGLLLLLGGVFINQNGAIIQRLKTVIAGTDGSFNYRFIMPMYRMRSILKSTYGAGLGAGMMNTVNNQIQLRASGGGVFANSFMYFIAENGYFGIVWLCLFLLYLYIKSYKNGYIIKFPLFFFAIVSQIGGGYFTNPIMWLIYGILLIDVGNSSVFKERIN